MGAIAEAIAEYAQPLIDATDGSLEQLNKALAISQACWNLALMPEDEREKSLLEMRLGLNLDDEGFEDFRAIVTPMIQRHKEMFPRMHGMAASEPSETPPRPHTRLMGAERTGKYPGTGRNAPCPCRSGRKYKVCCGR